MRVIRWCCFVDMSEGEEFVSLRAQRERQNFVPLAIGKRRSKSVSGLARGENAEVNRASPFARISKPHAVSGGTSRDLGETKALPLIAAVTVILTSLGLGLFDSFFLDVEGPEPSPNPSEFEAPIQEVNKSLVTVTKPGIGFPEMVFTRHRVSRGETVSRIAYRYGLSPATIVSVNKLNSAKILREGRDLMIPYIDGQRISRLGNESAGEIAARFNTAIDGIRLIPGSGDYFIYGKISDEASSPGTIRERFLYPVPGRILTAYGEIVDDLTDISYSSEGIGISVKGGTAVNSSKEGRVILTGHHSAYGLYVIMSHARGWKSFYGHLSSIQVAIGDELDAGELLGYSGASGAARSPRLLFVLIFAGKPVDPLDYLY